MESEIVQSRFIEALSVMKVREKANASNLRALVGIEGWFRLPRAALT